MIPKCFSCGKFLKIGMGTVTRIERFDGKGDQYFCESCVKEREEDYSREQGHPVTFQDEWCHVGTVTIV